MGPFFGIVPKCSKKIRMTLQREGLAEFMEGGNLVVGRLTPAGIALRDRWIRTDAIRLDKELQRGKTDPADSDER
jgi:hypothetical protein